MGDSVLIKVSTGRSSTDLSWSIRVLIVVAMVFLTSFQSILIDLSKKAGKYENNMATTNFLVEALKCLFSLLGLFWIWTTKGATKNNRLRISFDEVSVYPFPAALYLINYFLQRRIFDYFNAADYQTLKNLNIITCYVLCRIVLKTEKLAKQWTSLFCFFFGCIFIKFNFPSFESLFFHFERLFLSPLPGWLMVIEASLISGFADVYMEAIIMQRPSKNLFVNNFWFSIFGLLFNLIAIINEYETIVSNGFFYGYSFTTVCVIISYTLSGIVLSMTMKFVNSNVKIFATSIAIVLTTLVSELLFGFENYYYIILGAMLVCGALYFQIIEKIPVKTQ